MNGQNGRETNDPQIKIVIQYCRMLLDDQCEEEVVKRKNKEAATEIRPERLSDKHHEGSSNKKYK